MGERATGQLRPFPVDSVGRLAIDSLSLPVMVRGAWKVIDGLSQGMEWAEAAEYGGLESDRPESQARAITRGFRGREPFAVRLGIELGQIIQPCETATAQVLPLSQSRILYLRSRGISESKLIQTRRPEFSPGAIRASTQGLCESLGALNINNATRFAFKQRLFPPVDVTEARARYREILKAQRMRNFLKLAYPDYSTDECDDQKILTAVSYLDTAVASLWLRVRPPLLLELSARTARFKQWLDGTSTYDIARMHKLPEHRLWCERRSLATGLRRNVPADEFMTGDDAASGP